LKLPVDETDGHDAIFFRGLQQPLAGMLPYSIVLKGDPVESGERVPHMRFIVDRKLPPTKRVDVSKGAIRKIGPLTGFKSRHTYLQMVKHKSSHYSYKKQEARRITLAVLAMGYTAKHEARLGNFSGHAALGRVPCPSAPPGRKRQREIPEIRQ
jgi:hypothetical protein